MKKNLGKSVLVMLALCFGFAVGHTAFPDPEIDFAVARIVKANLINWKIGNVTSTTNFEIFENKTTNAPVAAWGPSGGFAPYARTSTQLSTLVADTSGQIVLNITTASLCVSTGTTAGAWVYLSTSATSGAAARWNGCTSANTN